MISRTNLLYGASALLVCALLALAKGKPGGKPGGGGGGALANPALVYTSERFSTDVQLYLRTADGTGVFQLTDPGNGWRDWMPEWSPDGERIAFLRYDPDRPQAELMTIAPDGSGLTLVKDFNVAGPAVPNTAMGTRLAWSPDGSKIAFGDMAVPEDLWVVDMTSGLIEVLVGDLYSDTGNPSFSPDLDPSTPGYQGRVVYQAQTAQTGGNADTVDLVLIDVAGDGAGGLVADESSVAVISLPSVQRWPAWSPDGNSIAFLSRRAPPDGGIWDLKVGTVSGSGLDSITTVVSQVPGAGSQYPGGPAWSSDSRYIAFSMSVLARKNKYTDDLMRVRPDGTGLTNLTNTSRDQEYRPSWNPAWANDLGD